MQDPSFTSLGQSAQNSTNNNEPSQMTPSPQPIPQQPQPSPQPSQTITNVNNISFRPNEPAGLTKIIDCPFTDSICELWDTYKSAKFAPVAVPGSSGPPAMALDNSLDVGASTGGGQMGYNYSAGVKEVYTAFWWSTNADFMGMCNNGNKMLFIRNATDNNFLLWSGAPGEKKKYFKWAMQASYDNCGHPGEYGMCFTKGDGTGWFEPNGEHDGGVEVNSGWHLIEIYLKSSTSKTSRDGIVRWAVDGKIVGNYPTVNLSPGGFEDFNITHTWDGSSCLVPPYRDMSKAWHHYFDHLYMSVRK